MKVTERYLLVAHPYYTSAESGLNSIQPRSKIIFYQSVELINMSKRVKKGAFLVVGSAMRNGIGSCNLSRIECSFIQPAPLAMATIYTHHLIHRCGRTHVIIITMCGVASHNQPQLAFIIIVKSRSSAIFIYPIGGFRTSDWKNGQCFRKTSTNPNFSQVCGEFRIPEFSYIPLIFGNSCANIGDIMIRKDCHAERAKLRNSLLKSHNWARRKLTPGHRKKPAARHFLT